MAFVREFIRLYNEAIPSQDKKQLKFYIEQNEVAELELPYTVYWKVRNVGIEAVKRNMIRGNLSRYRKRANNRNYRF